VDSTVRFDPLEGAATGRDHDVVAKRGHLVVLRRTLPRQFYFLSGGCANVRVLSSQRYRRGRDGAADRMKRREFITLLGAAAARAQQGERMRVVGVLEGYSAEDREAQARHAAFSQGLERLGGAETRNIRIERRYARGSLQEAQAKQSMSARSSSGSKRMMFADMQNPPSVRTEEG
jgi:hypothetical protein